MDIPSLIPLFPNVSTVVKENNSSKKYEFDWQ